MTPYSLVEFTEDSGELTIPIVKAEEKSVQASTKQEAFCTASQVRKRNILHGHRRDNLLSHRICTVSSPDAIPITISGEGNKL
jgi:hypothetical protein